MPALDKGSPTTVLITGANGFLGTWAVRTALERGYSVRAAVRSQKSGAPLLELFKSYGSKLELCFIGDIAEAGAFDEAVKNVQGIIHTASPVIFAPVDAKDVIVPAVNGAVGILQSAMKHANSLRRIVFTSSCAAVVFSNGERKTVSEKDWNEVAVAAAEKPGSSKYTASKVLAEKAVWDFYNMYKTQIPWDITVLNPPFIFGPGIHPHASPADLRAVCSSWYDVVIKGDFDGENSVTQPGHGWIDVRDCAEEHILSLETPEAGGERIIISAGGFVWQDWLDVARSLPATERQNYDISQGQEGQKTYAISFDTTKEKRVLGLQFRSKQVMTRDLLADFRSRGW